MKKFLKLSALFAVMSFLFLGCQEDGGKKPVPKPDGDTPITSIKILVNGSQESNPPLKMLIDDTAQLTAQIIPSTATEKGYTFELLDNDDGALSLNENNLLTALSAGQATIKVTSKGAKADGTFATDTLNVVVTEDPNIIQAALVIYNQNATPDAATTTTLPALNSDKRYVIVNNEANATLPAGWTSVAGNTIVYLNKPIKMQREAVDATTFNYTPFSISARVRITGGRTSGNLNDTGNCLVTGIFTNPTIAVSTDTPLYFVGMRHAWSGQKRVYASRDSDNSAAAFSNSAPDFDKADNASDKKSGFQEQEYVIKVEHTTGTTYTISAYKADGTTLIASIIRGSSSNQVNSNLQKDEYYYLGFIISGVTVEISNVVIKDGTETVFEAATDATPSPVAVKKVNITTPQSTPGDGFDYQATKDAFPTAGFQLSAEVIPTDASQDVTWSISQAGAGATVTAGLVKTNGTSGNFTVKAQSGTAFAEYKFGISEGIPPVTSIVVTGATTIMAGNGSGVEGETTEMVAEVEPTIAEATANITWSVTAADGTSPTTDATINPTTGMLKATDSAIADDVVVKVFASSNKGAGGTTITSEAYEVTVQKYAAFVNKTWNFSDPIWPWKDATGADYNYYENGGTNDGLTFVGSAKWGTQAVGTYNVGGMTFTKRVGANGNGSAGASANRLLKFDVAGPCTIKLYMASGGSTGDRTVKVVVLNNDNTVSGTALFSKSLNDTDVTYPIEVNYTGTDPATIGIYNNANNNYYCIKVEY